MSPAERPQPQRQEKSPLEPTVLTQIGATATPGLTPEHIPQAPEAPEARLTRKERKLEAAHDALKQSQGRADTALHWGHPRVAIHPKHVRRLKKVPGNMFSTRRNEGERPFSKEAVRRVRRNRRENRQDWEAGDRKAWNRSGTQRKDEAYRASQITQKIIARDRAAAQAREEAYLKSRAAK